MDPIVATFAVLVAAIVAFVSGRIPVAIVAVAVSVALWATGVLPLSSALAGFGDPTVIFIATLFVVSESLDASGATSWLGQRVVRIAGSSTRRAVVVVMLIVALLTALISVNGAVAALLPMTVIVAMRAGVASSRLLLPLAFGAHAGSLLTLTGTPVNVFIADVAASSGAGSIGYFDFALIGVPLVAVTVAIAAFLGPRLLPDRTPAKAPRDLSGHTSALRILYPEAVPAERPLISREFGVLEVVVPPRSSLIGTEAYAGMVTDSGSYVVLSIARNGREITPKTITIAAGDTLLLQGTWSDLQSLSSEPDVIVVDEADLVRRQLAPFGWRGWVAVANLAVMIVLLATGLLPPAIAGLLAAGVAILSRVVPLDRAYRNISWSTVILVAGMIPLSTAFLTTGAADLVADVLIRALGGADPRFVIFVICLVVMALGQVISNMATALIVAPIALAAATELGLSPLPFLMAVTTAAAAAFLTPFATPVNLMVQGPAGYTRGDYVRFGLPLLIVFLLAATFLVPVIWPF